MPPGLQEWGEGEEAWHAAMELVASALYGAGPEMWEASRLPMGCLVALPPGVTAKKEWGRTIPCRGSTVYLYQDPQGYLNLRRRRGGEDEWTQSVGVHRLVCWWAWGPPPPDRPQACHFVCDRALCLNPRHLRWGSDSDNRHEDHAIKRAKRATAFAQQTWCSAAYHPTKWMLRHDGFPVQI